jgi:hypothetical protein
MFEAEIELCETHGERIARRTNHLRILEKIESQLKAEAAEGLASRFEEVQARVMRLDAEIDLLREQLGKK